LKFLREFMLFNSASSITLTLALALLCLNHCSNYLGFSWRETVNSENVREIRILSPFFRHCRSFSELCKCNFISQ